MSDSHRVATFYIEDSTEDPKPHLLDDGKLIYAGHYCESIPARVMQHAGRIRALDLSYNSLSNLEGLQNFSSRLKELILDNNEIDEKLIFPKLQNLSLLSLCNNRVNEFCTFLDMLGIRTPKLEFLSLLGNPACPDSLTHTEHNEEDYLHYRKYVCYRLSRVRFLDSKPVSRRDREDGKRYGPLLKARQSVIEEPKPALRAHQISSGSKLKSSTSTTRLTI